ncbi:exo-alpha-sialidase [Aeoliella sp. ICT_H6.2]|uniref:exo-alpha-sialidase n=1 Tax=Aeoliella straminimaris TaxID=2954799 RepID=A0A9X2FED4_9BACT|nr:sialidase family protein [Aeoliella straminimaris]MCO6044286.1 exo-alpha-sialidase [Aeoliella straminimaris]
MNTSRAVAFIFCFYLLGTHDAVAATDDTTWFVRDGKAVDVVDATGAWQSTRHGLAATGNSSRLDAGQTVGKGDFEVFAELRLKDVGKDHASLMLDADDKMSTGEFVFSRNDHIYVRGFFFGDRTQRVRPLNGLIQSGEWFRVRVRREGNLVTFYVNDQDVWKMEYESARPFGKLSLNAGKARLTVRSFGVRGETNPLEEWTPRLTRDYSLAGEQHTDVYLRGQGGYHTYRIPAIVKSTEGTLLAFAEGRKKNQFDHGDIDIVLRRSVDDGRTWLPMQLVCEEGGDARVTIGNPVPVIDRDTGKIWLFFCRDNVDVLATCSEDDGQSWSEPVELTATLKRSEWTGWYATGPCHGVQLANGRLVVPANHNPPTRNKGTRVHMIVSDDHGATWRIGGVVDGPTNENSVAALGDGRLYVNARISTHHNRKPYCRMVAYSNDGGDSFEEPLLDRQLTCSICEASVLNVTRQQGGDVLLIANPCSQRRERMTVRASEDAGQTWNEGLRIYEGSSAYCDLVQLNDEEIGLIFERDLYQSLTFVRIKLSSVLENE